MAAQSQPSRESLLQTDEEFDRLAAQHQELEDRLKQLTAKSYLSEPEQLEEITLKKRKLQLKDRMEGILRRHRQGQTVQAASVPPAQGGPGRRSQARS